MTETQRRIKAYQELLPALRERVMAVALLLAMSASMLSSASFAWLTLSRNPEVTAVNTTVAANGNLEIALATGDIYSTTAPGDSQVGDSTAAKGQSVKDANITWGNLVNLADPSYGLEKMVLRPAQLNQSSLLNSPLYGATYGTDGRTENLSSDFAYSTWEPGNKEMGTQDGFVINNKLGVRAITSIVYQADQGTAYQAKQKRDAAENMNTIAGTTYLGITQNSNLMSSLATVMGAYLTASLNDGEADAIKYQDVFNLSEIFRLFIEAYEQQLQAMVNLANYQLFVLNNSTEGSTSYTEYTLETLLADSTKESNLYAGVQLPGLDQLKADYKMLKENYSSDTISNDMMELVAQAEANGSLPYNAMESIVDKLVVVGTCKVGDKTVDALAADKSAAISLVMGGGTHKVQITNGVLYNFEKLNGTRAEIKGMSIKAKYMITVTLNADITTSAPTPHQFQTALDYGDANNKGGALTGYSEDTYGLAIDLWLRTNAPDSYLTLEGNVLTESHETYPTITVSEDIYTVKLNGVETQIYKQRDSEGNVVWYNAETNARVDLGEQEPTRTTQPKTYDLYTVSVSEESESGESLSYNVDVYQKTKPDGTTVWCNASNHSEMELEADQTPSRKIEMVETVIGYEGENRVWDRDNNTLISADATTQGSGSCYVYYADTPEDQARSLALLDAFKVAFVSDRGDLMATASMDTEHFYATTGRVIVPLKLDEAGSIKLVNEATGDVRYAITGLNKNEPMRITALVYLDGTKLNNENVLAAADIQGRLNIQFGTSEEMQPIQNMELANKVRTVRASLNKTEFNYDEDDDMTAEITITVDGDTPGTVQAFFLREINSSQGSREETIQFEKTSEREWVGTYTFPAPGNYVLRSVQLDGVEYDLPLGADGQPLRATVKGFALEYLRCSEGSPLEVMTTNSSQKVNLELKFATEDKAKLPKTVRGLYLRSDGTAVNVDFNMDSQMVWKGSATFVASGKYTMQYLILDGNYTELPSGFWLTANLTMGMRVFVDTTSPRQFTYIPEKLTDAQRNLGMQVTIMDGENNELKSLLGAYLYYNKSGTTDIEKGLSTPLTWDSSQNCYTGTFLSKVGIFNFDSVTVGSNTLRNTTGAPQFRILSPEPPEFNRDATPADQFVMGTNDASMKVYIDNCEAATVYADLVKDGVTGRTYPVEGRLTSDGAWTFDIPMLTGSNDVAASGQEGTQDGKWTIQQIRIWDAYDENSKEFTQEEPLVFGNDTYTFNTTKVISKAYVTLSVPEGWDKELGKTDNTVDGALLTSYQISGLKVQIKDFEGNPIKGLSLNMDYKYGKETVDYGGYTKDGLANLDVNYTVTFKLDPNDMKNTTYIQDGSFTVDQAGTYTPTLTYTINSKTYDVDESVFAFSVHNVKPKLTIQSIKPVGSHKTVNSSDSTVTVTSKVEGNTITIYPDSEVTGSGCNKKGKLNQEPIVTLRFVGLGKATDAALTFTSTESEVRMYYGSSSKEGTQTPAYVWNQSTGTDVSRFIGYNDAGSCDDSKYAGTLTSGNEIVMTKDEDTYRVQVSAITIINVQP